MRKLLEELSPKSFADWTILTTALVLFMHGLIERLT
jgi:hypothetical protein